MDLNATNAEKFSFLENNVKDLRSRIDAISLKQKETTKIQLANLEEKVDAQVEVLLEAVQDAQKSFKEYIVENDSNIREEVAQQMTEKFEACDIAYDHSFHLYTQRTVEEGNRLANFVDTTIASTKESLQDDAEEIASQLRDNVDAIVKAYYVEERKRNEQKVIDIITKFENFKCQTKLDLSGIKDKQYDESNRIDQVTVMYKELSAKGVDQQNLFATENGGVDQQNLFFRQGNQNFVRQADDEIDRQGNADNQSSFVKTPNNSRNQQDVRFSFTTQGRMPDKRKYGETESQNPKTRFNNGDHGFRNSQQPPRFSSVSTRNSVAILPSRPLTVEQSEKLCEQDHDAFFINTTKDIDLWGNKQGTPPELTHKNKLAWIPKMCTYVRNLSKDGNLDKIMFGVMQYADEGTQIAANEKIYEALVSATEGFVRFSSIPNRYS